MTRQKSDSLGRSILKDLFKWVVIPFALTMLAMGLLWLLLAVHLVLAAKVLLVILIIVGILTYFMVL